MNIVVNGGTKGIGFEVVKFLAKDPSNRIIATGRNEILLRELSDSHINVISISIDLSDFEKYKSKFEKLVRSEFGSLDILINTAGLLIPHDFIKTTADEARLVMETNFFGSALIIQTLQPFMPKGSHIVNISSMGGFQGSTKYRGLSFYSASKAALSCLTECLALEFSELGINVNCLALGSVQTEMLNKAFPGFKAPVEAAQMAEFIAGFALTGHKFFNGKILPVAVGKP